MRGPAANVDQLIVGGVLGPTKAGIYRLANSFASLPGIAAAALRFAEMPRIMAAAVRGDNAALRKELRRLSLLSATMGGLATLAWIVAGGSILRLVNSAFLPVFPIATILFIAGAVSYTTSWSKSLPILVDRARWALVEGLIYIVLAPFIIFVGTRLAGLVGAATAMVAIATTSTAVWVATAAGTLRDR